MSTIRVATIETENDTTDLTITTGNTSGPDIVVSAGNNDVNLTGDFIVSGNVASTNIPSGVLVTESSTSTLTNKTLTDPAINLGSDATGDLYYRASDNSFERLPIGSTDQVLTVASGLPSWTAAATFSSYPGVFSDSGSQSITSTEATLEFDTEDLDPDTNYALSSGAITVTIGGYFQVSVNIPIDDVDALGGTRAAVFAFLQRDQGTGTWISDAQTRPRGQDYARETSGGEGVNFSGIVQLADGEALRVRIAQSGTVTLSTETGQASLTIHRVRAT